MTHASLFSGIGGAEVAATMMGWENLFHCEINAFCRQVLNYWYPKSVSYEDITKTDFSEWRGKIDVLTGGFPCQPFSVAGKRKGKDDDRYLWPEMCRVIDDIRPTWVVGENVTGLNTMVEQGEIISMESEKTIFEQDNRVCRYKYNQTYTIERICSDIERLGYSVQPVVIPACAVEAPHRRDRLFIICYATDTADARIESVRQERQDAIYKPGLATNTQRSGGRALQRNVEQKLADGEKFVGNDSKRIITNGCSERLFLRDDKRCEEREQDKQRYLSEKLCSEKKWQAFPTVSPVYGGDDGLSFDVDDLTISVGKWRAESIKAHGNAIVPQVMYEIFRAIDKIEKL